MPKTGLFDREQAVIENAREALANGALVDPVARDAFEHLLKSYQKLYKTSAKLIRLSDVNERKLAQMAEQQRRFAEEIDRKNKALEALSSKLSKYLSPQVYNSIFSGEQEVSLASRRKKLTVFFSDIAGFTEITDKMESEDVTQIINEYLTEMSEIALKYGATIDKFIGDAVMIFFGDPESKGVREDAIACVRMALDMQKRIRELGAYWRRSGLEKPMQCRMGINSGYCTVGNFGSTERMDYTIVGGGVNLASRLESYAKPGEILISYETYAHVRDDVRCEPVGEVQVKGIAYPVSTYRVVGVGASEKQTLAVDLPYLKLNADLGSMSDTERAEATACLESLLVRLHEAAQSR